MSYEKENRKVYKAMLWKAYFDKGFSLLNFLTKGLLFVGFADILSSGGDASNVIIIGFAYFLFCILLGRLWFYFKLVNAEHEVQNIVDPFVGEMRKELIGKPNNRKVYKR